MRANLEANLELASYTYLHGPQWSDQLCPKQLYPTVAYESLGMMDGNKIDLGDFQVQHIPSFPWASHLQLGPTVKSFKADFVVWYTSENTHPAPLTGFWRKLSEQWYSESSLKTCARLAGCTTRESSGQKALRNRDPQAPPLEIFFQTVCGGVWASLSFKSVSNTLICNHHTNSGEGHWQEMGGTCTKDRCKGF